MDPQIFFILLIMGTPKRGPPTLGTLHMCGFDARIPEVVCNMLVTILILLQRRSRSAGQKAYGLGSGATMVGFRVEKFRV